MRFLDEGQRRAATGHRSFGAPRTAGAALALVGHLIVCGFRYANVAQSRKFSRRALARRADGVLQPEASADVPHEPERGFGIATIEERSIELREDAHSE